MDVINFLLNDSCCSCSFVDHVNHSQGIRFYSKNIETVINTPFQSNLDSPCLGQVVRRVTKICCESHDHMTHMIPQNTSTTGTSWIALRATVNIKLVFSVIRLTPQDRVISSLGLIFSIIRQMLRNFVGNFREGNWEVRIKWMWYVA